LLQRAIGERPDESEYRITVDQNDGLDAGQHAILIEAN
jgi:hypothetical protein